MSDAVRTLYGPLVSERYVTDAANFSGRGDIFTEHARHIYEVLMSVFKYLMGRF